MTETAAPFEIRRPSMGSRTVGYRSGCEGCRPGRVWFGRADYGWLARAAYSMMTRELRCLLGSNLAAFIRVGLVMTPVLRQ